jgi:hypothetical protein
LLLPLLILRKKNLGILHGHVMNSRDEIYVKTAIPTVIALCCHHLHFQEDAPLNGAMVKSCSPHWALGLAGQTVETLSVIVKTMSLS